MTMSIEHVLPSYDHPQEACQQLGCRSCESKLWAPPYIIYGTESVQRLDYRLRDLGSVTVRGRNFSLWHRVQTDSWTHPASYPMGTGALF